MPPFYAPPPSASLAVLESTFEAVNVYAGSAAILIMQGALVGNSAVFVLIPTTVSNSRQSLVVDLQTWEVRRFTAAVTGSNSGALISMGGALYSLRQIAGPNRWSVLQSLDLGESWGEITNSVLVAGFQFGNSGATDGAMNAVFVCGGTLIVTTDGGATWAGVSLPGATYVNISAGGPQPQALYHEGFFYVVSLQNTGTEYIAQIHRSSDMLNWVLIWSETTLYAMSGRDVYALAVLGDSLFALTTRMALSAAGAINSRSDWRKLVMALDGSAPILLDSSYYQGYLTGGYAENQPQTMAGSFPVGAAVSYRDKLMTFFPGGGEYSENGADFQPVNGLPVSRAMNQYAVSPLVTPDNLLLGMSDPNTYNVQLYRTLA